ncbi:hypothetical protein VPH35_010017 [Triticum aestivum]
MPHPKILVLFIMRMHSFTIFHHKILLSLIKISQVLATPEASVLADFTGMPAPCSTVPIFNPVFRCFYMNPVHSLDHHPPGQLLLLSVALSSDICVFLPLCASTLIPCHCI